MNEEFFGCFKHHLNVFIISSSPSSKYDGHNHYPSDMMQKAGYRSWHIERYAAKSRPDYAGNPNIIASTPYLETACTTQLLLWSKADA
jgi:hypothetical protein